MWVAGIGAALVLAVGSVSRAQDREAVALIRQGIKAAGGQKVLESLKAAQSKSKGTIHYPTVDVGFTAEEFLVFPDKMRSNIQADAGGMKVMVVVIFDGKSGWVQENGKTKDLDEQGVAEMKATAYASKVGSLIDLLKDKEFKLSSLPDAKVAGKVAAGVLVQHPGQRDIKLYFDKASSLLLKTETKAIDPQTKKEVNQEKIFGDYKAVQGRQVPFRVTVNQDGRLYMEIDITEVRIVDQLEPALFTKPK
jgi:hypothetical protein